MQPLRFVLLAAIGCGTTTPSGPLCETEPSSFDAATDVRIQLRGRDVDARPVFVQNAAGDLLLDGVTDADGSFTIDEVPANAVVTVDLGDDEHRLVSYLGLQSGETVVVGSTIDETSVVGTTTVTVRFPQLDLPTTSSYDVVIGPNCAFQSVIFHDATQPTRVQAIDLVPSCPGAPDGWASVIAISDTGQFLGVAGVEFQLPASGTQTVDVGPWNTETTSIRATTSEPVAQIMVLPERHTELLTVVAADHPAGAVVFPRPGDVVDATHLVAYFDDGRGYSLRTSTTTDLTITDEDLLPVIDGVYTEIGEHAAVTMSWQYTGPSTATIASYLLSVDSFRIRREAVIHGSDCSVTLPPLPDRYEIKDVDDRFVSGGETGVISFIHGVGLTREDANRLLIDDYEAPLDVGILSVQLGDDVVHVVAP